MELRRLELRNFCRHQARVIDFRCGMTAIVGPNGSGKSNLLSAIQWALTGENMNAGVKADNVCQSAKEGDPSYVQLSFVHGSASVSVTRYLQPPSTKSKLEIDGEPTIYGDNAINAKIQDLLGVDADLLNSIILVPQGEIFSFLGKTPAKRAEALQRIFRTDYAEAIYRALGKRCSEIELPVVTVDVDDLRYRLADTSAQLAQVQQYLRSRRPLEDLQKAQAADMRIREAWTYCRQMMEYRDRMGAEADAAYAEVQKLKATVERLVSELRREETTAAELREAYEHANGVLAAIKYREAVQRRRDELRVRIELRQRELSQMVAPAKPEDYRSPDDVFRQVLNEMSNEISTDDAFIKSFNPQLGIVCCPTCRTPVANILPRLYEVQDKLPAKIAAYQSATEQYRRSVRYDQEYSDYITRKQELERQIDQLQQEDAGLRGLEDTSLPAKEQMEETIRRYTTCMERVEGFRRELAEAQTAEARWQGQHAKLLQNLAEVQREIVACPVTAQEAEAAEARLASYRDELNDLMAATSKMTALRASVESLQAQLAEAEVTIQRAKQIRDKVEHLKTVRDLFHKDAAPAVVAQNGLRRLEYVMNEQLSLFGADFRVTAEEGCSFVALFTDGRRQPAERLSGGQKVVLALAFRLAAYFLYAGDLGLLVLDEPTVYLDKAFLSAMAQVLERLRDMVSSRGLSLLIITHEDELAPLFDHVIALGS